MVTLTRQVTSVRTYAIHKGTELVKQQASERAARSRRWPCVAGTLSFIVTVAASCHVISSSRYTRLNECIFSTLGDFLQIDKWTVLSSTAFASNSVSNREKLLRRHFRCCNRFMERIVWAARNVTSGTGVSNRAEPPSKTTPNLDGIPRQWTTITLRKCLLWFVKFVA